jgi:SNF2 family DNA or RNA helicase
MKVPETVKKVIKTVADNQHKPDNNYAASKVVVFTNFKESGKRLADQIRENLQKINPKFKLITYLGDTPSAERREVKNNFTNDPNAKVLVMSMKMGSTGIDFPNAARNMVINDFDWTPESAEQSEGRIYRINTDHPVDISYMVSQGIDSNLFDKVQKKRELAAIIHKFRQELHERPDDEATVGKIVKAKKEMKKLDQDLESEINKLTSETVEEGFDFRRYFDHCQDMKRVIF